MDRWESLCDPSKGCHAACCYFEGSPCEELDRETLRCRVYITRFGLRQTVDGKPFRCAPMAEKLLVEGVPHVQCGYRVVRSIEHRPVAINPEVPVIAGLP